MHLFKQHAVKDFGEAAAKIPLIDYGPHFAGDLGALSRLADEVRYACENIGFFYVVNHGVAQRSSTGLRCLAKVPCVAAGSEAQAAAE